MCLSIIEYMQLGLHGPRSVQRLVPGPSQQMRDGFSNRQGRQMRGDFSNGPAQERRFFEQGGPAKEKRVFQQPGQATKKGRLILRVSPGRRNKDKVFKPADKSFIMKLI